MSLSWFHGEAAVQVHYNYSCQGGSRALYKWALQCGPGIFPTIVRLSSVVGGIDYELDYDCE
jgi:hypothetical protein